MIHLYSRNFYKKGSFVYIVDYEVRSNRQVEADNIREKVTIAEGYKVAFDVVLLLIYEGDVEQVIIDAENN